MADINTIIRSIATGLAKDSDISDWSQSGYGRDCTVYENCDPRNAPGAEHCPLIILYPLAKDAGLDRKEKGHILGVAPWVYDSGRPEDEDGIVCFSGGRNVEELRKLALIRVVIVLKSLGLKLVAVKTEYNPINDFPLVSSDMELTITERKLIGVNPYE